MIQKRFICTDCRAVSPNVTENEASTLISMRYGWRITRRHDAASDASVMEARCPTCWAKRRASAAGDGSMTGSRRDGTG